MLRLLRGPEVNPGSRALLVASPRVGPRLGAGFPRLAALSPARCLSWVAGDRASRANIGVPGAQHALSTTPGFASGFPLLPSPRPGGHLEGLSASAAGPRLPVLLLLSESVRVWDVLGGSKALLADIHPEAKHGPGKPVCLPGLSLLPAQRVICLFLFWFWFAW